MAVLRSQLDRFLQRGDCFSKPALAVENPSQKVRLIANNPNFGGASRPHLPLRKIWDKSAVSGC